jgi:MFS family permease
MAVSPFAIRDFRLFWISRLAATLAQIAVVVVIGWQVYDIARNHGLSEKAAALQLGFVGLAQFLPLFALTLPAGLTADKFDRRYIAWTSTLLQVICTAALALLAHFHMSSLPAIFAIAALLGVARAFQMPAMSAISPNLVPKEILPRAIAMSSFAWQGAAIAGPAMGGYFYAIGPDVPYWVSAGLQALSLLCLLALRPLPPREQLAKASPWRQMVDGLHYVRQNRLVLGAISLDLFAVLLGGATAMLPVYARDILHVGPEGLGHLRAAPAIGATLVALWFSWRPLKHGVGIKLFGAVALFGAATVGFGLSTSMPLSLLCLLLLGAADMFSVFVRQSLMLLYTPDEMRGRVGAVSGLFISASNELGEAESGLLASLVGPVAAVVAGGLGAIGVTLLWMRFFPELRRASTFDPPDALAPGGTP